MSKKWNIVARVAAPYYGGYWGSGEDLEQAIDKCGGTHSTAAIQLTAVEGDFRIHDMDGSLSGDNVIPIGVIAIPKLVPLERILGMTSKLLFDGPIGEMIEMTNKEGSAHYERISLQEIQTARDTMEKISMLMETVYWAEGEKDRDEKLSLLRESVKTMWDLTQEASCRLIPDDMVYLDTPDEEHTDEPS